MSSAMACRVYRTVLLFSDDGGNYLNTPQISDAFRGVIVEELPLSVLANLAATKRDFADSLHQDIRIQETGESSKVHETVHDFEA